MNCTFQRWSIYQSVNILWQNGKWLRQYLNTLIRSTSSIEVLPRSIRLCWIEKWESYCHIFSSHKCWLDWTSHYLWLNFEHPKCGQSLLHVLAQSWRRDSILLFRLKSKRSMWQNVQLHLYQSSTTISIFSKKMLDDDGKLLIFHKSSKSFLAHFELTKPWNGLFTLTLVEPLVQRA